MFTDDDEDEEIFLVNVIQLNLKGVAGNWSEDINPFTKSKRGENMSLSNPYRYSEEEATEQLIRTIASTKGIRTGYNIFAY